MAAYTTGKEYWQVVEARYANFARPGDMVEVVDSFYKPNSRCHLCDHDISNCFIIKNLATQETIQVGSHCVENRVKIEKKWRQKIKEERLAALKKTEAPEKKIDSDDLPF